MTTDDIQIVGFDHAWFTEQWWAVVAAIVALMTAQLVIIARARVSPRRDPEPMESPTTNPDRAHIHPQTTSTAASSTAASSAPTEGPSA